MTMYPLKFRPVFKEKVWGGDRLRQFHRDLPRNTEHPIGESWEITDLPEGQSTVANGPLEGTTLAAVIETYGQELLGDLNLTKKGRFPLLLKFLDARENLSVQVHPDYPYSERHPEADPKYEAWYILHAEPGGRIYRGIRPGVSRDAFRRAIEENRSVEDLLNEIPVKAGECYYLPGGTCHALGAGVAVIEAQTPSDTTYRVYDWGRTSRELHIEQAMAVMRFDDQAEAIEGESSARPRPVAEERRRHIGGPLVTVSRLCTANEFTIEKIRMSEGYQQELPYQRPAVWVVLSGRGQITGTPAGIDVGFGPYDVMLLPAEMPDARVELTEDSVWLDIQFPTPWHPAKLA